MAMGENKSEKHSIEKQNIGRHDIKKRNIERHNIERQNIEKNKIENITAVIDYIEAHLREKMDLDRIAQAVHYSKFYLHRMFTGTVGITIHDYIQRRQLTEAAKLLVFSQKPILEIALIAGYESQQAFTDIFKAMYKRTPKEYRENQVFYPLQLEFVLNRNPSPETAPDYLRNRISYGETTDIPDWMDFVSLVIDGFPGFEENGHRQRIEEYVARGQVLIVREREYEEEESSGIIIGGAAFTRQRGSIDFLGVHPQYRYYGVAKALLDFMLERVFGGGEISITTFREGDRADTGQRAEYQGLGFVESELLTEFGYPTQRMVLEVKK